MSRLPIWWPVRGFTIGILAAATVYAFAGHWQTVFGALVWLVLVLFLSLTRASKE